LHHGLILGFDVLVDPRSIRKVLVTRPSEGVQDNAIASAVALDHCQKIFDRELEHSARSGGNLSDFVNLVSVLYVSGHLVQAQYKKGQCITGHAPRLPGEE